MVENWAVVNLNLEVCATEWLNSKKDSEEFNVICTSKLKINK